MSKIVKIRSITYDPKDELGRGFSSVVFRGKFEERDVAVKKVEKKNFKLMVQEIELLKKSDGHPNIIRYFCTEEDDEYCYIAVELCLCTLKDYVTNEELKNRISIRTITEQFFSGMMSLHALTIIHRDIKPTNVLLKENAQGELIVKISDFGFSKELSKSDSEMSITVRGSRYWSIPEVRENKYNFKSDVFSAGRIVHFLSMEGSVDENKVTWGSKSEDTSENVTLKHLVMIMTRIDPAQRPPIYCLLQHPFFWENQKVLNFFISVTNRLKNSDETAIITKKLLQENAYEVIDKNWLDSLDVAVKRSLGNVYNGTMITELLRSIRNLSAHFHELNQDTKDTFGSIPDGFTNYWIQKFPRLLMHVFIKVCQSGLARDVNFSQFFQKKPECDAAQS